MVEGTKRKARREAGRTQWAAQFAVASELCKRGYEVSFTMGNSTPLADLMVVSPAQKSMFLVDVKGLYRKNYWLIKRKSARVNLFYICVLVPENDANRYFIMSQEQVDEYIQAEMVRLKQPDNYSVTGISWKQAEIHEGNWGILPA